MGEGFAVLGSGVPKVVLPFEEGFFGEGVGGEVTKGGEYVCVVDTGFIVEGGLFVLVADGGNVGGEEVLDGGGGCCVVFGSTLLHGFARNYLAVFGDKISDGGFEKRFCFVAAKTFLHGVAVWAYYTERCAIDFAFGFVGGFINSVVG